MSNWLSVLSMLPYSPNYRRAFWIGFALGVVFVFAGIVIGFLHWIVSR